MALRDVMGTIKEKAEELEAVTEGKVTEGLDECKKAIATLEAFGSTVGSLTVGMGILPEIRTSISGSIENIHEDELKKIIQAQPEEKLLVSLLDALVTAKRLWEHVQLKLTSVTLNVTLGLPPKVTAEMR